MAPFAETSQSGKKAHLSEVRDAVRDNASTTAACGRNLHHRPFGCLNVRAQWSDFGDATHTWKTLRCRSLSASIYGGISVQHKGRRVRTALTLAWLHCKPLVQGQRVIINAYQRNCARVVHPTVFTMQHFARAQKTLCAQRRKKKKASRSRYPDHIVVVSLTDYRHTALSTGRTPVFVSGVHFPERHPTWGAAQF